MGVFNIIETFFFISLAITFILILLIVNHFKQRINTIENKCDTMFEIINNLIKEFENIKKINYINMHMGRTTPISKSNPEIFTENVEYIEPEIINNIKSKIVVSDDEYEKTEKDDCNDIEETSNEDSDEDTEEYSVEYDNDNENENENEYGEEYSDDEYDKDIVNNKLFNPINNYNIQKDNIQKDNIENTENIESIDNLKIVNIDDSLNNINKSYLEENINDNIHVEKINILEPLESLEINIIKEDTKEDIKEFYNKMTVQDLKKMVITKGLCSDPSKMKKNELLKMLEM